MNGLKFATPILTCCFLLLYRHDETADRLRIKKWRLHQHSFAFESITVLGCRGEDGETEVGMLKVTNEVVVVRVK